MLYKRDNVERCARLLEGFGRLPAGNHAGEDQQRLTRSKRNARLFERDYPALLLALASSVRTGLDPLTALLGLERLFSGDSPIRMELTRLKAAFDTGASEDDAIRGFAASINHPDIELFRTAFLLSRREGASLAECLQRLARVTRQRQSFRRKARSAVAMQKLSAIGIALSAVLMSVIQGLSNPKALALAIHNPTGLKFLLAGTALIAGGLVWMLRLCGDRQI